MNFLRRTQRLLQGLAPPTPARVQYYNVTCPDGHRLRGERTEGYQALRCPTCGEGMFVLPRSPLPEPPASEAPRASRKTMAEPSSPFDGPIELSDPFFSQQEVPLEADAEIEWVDPEVEAERPEDVPEPTAEEPPARARTTEAPRRPKPKSGPVPESSGGGAGATKPKARPKPKPAAPPDDARVASPPGRRPTTPRAEPAAGPPRWDRLASWAQRNRNPLIFLAVGLVVVSTIGFRLWRARFQDLPRIAEIGRIEGLAALDAGKFDTAHQQLSEAARAVVALGGAVEGAAEIRQGAGEAAILTSLVPDSLESILADASADPKDRASRFETLYKGRSIIIDAHITATPDASGSGRFELDYRVLPAIGGAARPRVGRIDLTGVALFQDATHKVGDRVVFGARLASLNLDESERWWFGLAPEGAIYMTHTKALHALGWPDVDELAGEERP